MTNAFNLSQLANNTNSSGQVTLTTGVAGTLLVANGGTGAATLTTGNLLVGAGTSAVTGIAAGTTGNVLTSNGTTWASAAAAGGGFTNMVSFVGPVAATTWASPPSTSRIKVTVQAGGGNNSNGYPGFPTAVGGGGAGGGGSVRYFAITGGTAYNYAVGGAAGATSFGPVGGLTVSATGGATGTGGPAGGGPGTGGAGGVGSGGNYNYTAGIGPSNSMLGSTTPQGGYGGGTTGSPPAGPARAGAVGCLIIEY